MYNGCVIAQIRDYRIAASAENVVMEYALLRPTQQVSDGVNALLTLSASDETTL